MRIQCIGFSFALSLVVGCSRPEGGSASDSTPAGRDSVATSVAPPVTATPARQTADPGKTNASTKQQETAVPAPPSGRPHLTSLIPSSVSTGSGAVITVVVSGTGLTVGANHVFFGSIDLGQVISDGKTLQFTVPQTVPPRSEVPPMAVQPGRYAVYVVNANGVSDSLSFILNPTGNSGR